MKKKLSMLLVIPILLFSQNQTYPDTVITNNGKAIPGLITKLDKEKVSLKYGDNEYPSGTGITNIEKIVLDEKGTIYKKGSGFLLDIKSIEKYILKRNTFLAQQKRIQEKAKKKKQFSKITSQLKTDNKKSKYSVKGANENRGSFGIFYVPFYSYSLYYFDYYYESFAIIINNLSIIEGQFSYRLSPKLSATFDLGYSSSYSKRRDETHRDYNNPDYNDYDYGTIETADIKLFVANVGFKFYFKQLVNKKVSPYLLFGAGKQFAFITENSKALFDDDPTPSTIESNIDEYNEQLNSPLNANCGFGVEYSFNESLSLFSSVRLYYTKINADYDYRSVSNYVTENRIKEVDKTEINTRIGLGLNFYF